jgi:dihydrodipicolinate reductase
MNLFSSVNHRSPGLVLLAALAVFGSASCSETAATGVAVNIPQVQIRCTSDFCKANSTADVVMIRFSTSSCTDEFGVTVSTSLASMSCNGTTGCTGTVNSPWLNTSHLETTTMPSGTYTLCAIMDFNNNSNGIPSSGDSVGTINSVPVTASTGLQIITSFSDIP